MPTLIAPLFIIIVFILAIPFLIILVFTGRVIMGSLPKDEH